MALFFHFGKFSFIDIKHGRSDAANGYLERLKQILKVQKKHTHTNTGVFNITTMKLELVEKIHEVP